MTTAIARSLLLSGGRVQNLISKSSPSTKNILSNSLSRRCASDLIEVDHYTSGWNLTDLDGYKPGKYEVKTYNKISSKVCVFVTFARLIALIMKSI